MRTAEELKKLAYAEMEPELSTTEPSELCFWVTMLYIYKMYAAKMINKGAAQRLTFNAEREFEEMKLWERLYKQYTDRENKAEIAISAYSKSPTEENKDKLIRALIQH